MPQWPGCRPVETMLRGIPPIGRPAGSIPALIVGDAVMDRLGNLTARWRRTAAKARFRQLLEVYWLSDQMVVGRGFAQLATPFTGIDATDGEVLTAIITMGVPVGSIQLIGLVRAWGQVLGRVRRSACPRLIVTGAVIAGLLAAIPLTSVTSGEIGLLFWAFRGRDVAGPGWPVPGSTACGEVPRPAQRNVWVRRIRLPCCLRGAWC